MRGMTAKRWTIITVAAAALIAATAGPVIWIRAESPSQTQIPVADPEPRISGAGVEIGSDGGAVTFGAVDVLVPRDAVPAGSTIKVLPVDALGESLGEIFGQPIAVEHAQPLRKPLQVRWNVAD